MNREISLVITTINPPNEVLKTWARECGTREIHFIVIGDQRTPTDFSIEGCDFVDIGHQAELGFSLISWLPLNHYSRKNLGYLRAIRAGSKVIMETDDDNFPKSVFFDLRPARRIVNTFQEEGWMNVYRYFGNGLIWPRGYPLELIMEPGPETEQFREELAFCPIHQGMADGSADVDAIFRLTRTEPVLFDRQPDLALGKNVWCPFNSQNTIWAKPSFMLMYLPSTCSFRMTDIWRSFIAQRVAWTCDWNVLFHESSVIQQRNPHRLMQDFRDEIPGYLNNLRIAEMLTDLELEKGAQHIPANLLKCYEAFVSMGLMEHDELKMVSAWIADVNNSL